MNITIAPTELASIIRHDYSALSSDLLAEMLTALLALDARYLTDVESAIVAMARALARSGDAALIADEEYSGERRMVARGFEIAGWSAGEAPELITAILEAMDLEHIPAHD